MRVLALLIVFASGCHWVFGHSAGVPSRSDARADRGRFDSVRDVPRADLPRRADMDLAQAKPDLPEDLKPKPDAPKDLAKDLKPKPDAPKDLAKDLKPKPDTPRDAKDLKPPKPDVPKDGRSYDLPATCAGIASQYTTVLGIAKSCTTNSDCALKVPAVLGCSCKTFANKTHSFAQLTLDLAAKWMALSCVPEVACPTGCLSTPPACAASKCIGSTL